MMPNILTEILSQKRLEIDQLKSIPSAKQNSYEIRSLSHAMSAPGISVIAEIKPKSPSAGTLLPDGNFVQVAKDYVRAGAAAISVLTDEKYFGGSLELLAAIRQAVSVPVLMKDFIIHEKQIYQSLEARADAILLIAEALTRKELSRLYKLAVSLGLEVLIEFHDPENLPGILDIQPRLIGFNCRNLNTMTTHISLFEKFADLIPKNVLKVAESGIHTNAELEKIENWGYNGVLIGTSLLKTGNPGKALKILLNHLATEKNF